ncbi:MAG: adenosine deaminase, partial [Spirochaetaceae bacterium]|nr:adenosine deaminase [Spirochaetaceae bacterium]
MVSENEFINHSKVDAHNHLNLGMRYDSYKIWAGFEIPDFPKEKYNGLGEMHEYIGKYTRPRAVTAQDAEDLITMSLEDAVKDGVTVVEGSVDIQFVGHCENSIDNFLKMVSKIKDNFKDKID